MDTSPFKNIDIHNAQARDIPLREKAPPGAGLAQGPEK
jgi:hypothetical protein